MYSVLDTSDKYIRNKITRTPKCFSVFLRSDCSFSLKFTP